jgi:hypothetical protein
MTNQTKALLALLLLLASSTFGCRRQAADLSGDWVFRGVLPKNLPPVTYSDPKRNKEIGVRLRPGSEAVSATLHLSPNHRFTWSPFPWAGTWVYRDGKVTLKPDKNYLTLQVLNGYSESSTMGIPDVTMYYSPIENALKWTHGWKRFKNKLVMVFKRER